MTAEDSVASLAAARRTSTPSAGLGDDGSVLRAVEHHDEGGPHERVDVELEVPKP